MDLRTIRLGLLPVLGLVFLAATPAQVLGQSEKVEAGRETYNQYCLICHGHEMVSPGGGSYDLRKFPKDQRARFGQSVLNGRPPGMPSWKAQLSEQDVETLWLFLLSGGDPSRPATGGR